ncbi:MAG: hypothetical protein ABI898_07185 [Sphingomonadales bacterium]
MRRLWCTIFGHKIKRPRKSLGESGLYSTCTRCDTFFIRDYFSGWQRASESEKAYYLKAYGPNAADPKNSVAEEVETAST